MNSHLLGAYYEDRRDDIHDIIRRSANSWCSVRDIERRTGLREDEINMIVDADFDLEKRFGGDYVKSYR